MFTAVVYVLTSGCTWRQLSGEFGVTRWTAHRRFAAWTGVIGSLGCDLENGVGSFPSAGVPRHDQAARPGCGYVPGQVAGQIHGVHRVRGHPASTSVPVEVACDDHCRSRVDVDDVVRAVVAGEDVQPVRAIARHRVGGHRGEDACDPRGPCRSGESSYGAVRSDRHHIADAG
ncbi:transposase [Actinomadura sp. LCR2-06]|uniref:Transposase n=1 Tax=Actinomadura violacea TaxID=2819934 RepID=A0ABS3RQ53_9ACTN|nr:transposase [Actinomadura violacea]